MLVFSLLCRNGGLILAIAVQAKVGLQNGNSTLVISVNAMTRAIRNLADFSQVMVYTYGSSNPFLLENLLYFFDFLLMD